MAERVANPLSDAGSDDRAEEQLGTDSLDRSSPVPRLKHCWVAGPDGTVPGLLLGWRHDSELGWLGRVVRPVRDEVGWLVMEDWLPADELRPASTGGPDR
jgi:hypothetical protein